MASYDKLDAAILENIRLGRSFFQTIQASKSVIEESSLQSILRGQPQTWRIVDSRLQALRKAGRITFVRGPKGGWQVAGE